jgi:hypothetical protein
LARESNKSFWEFDDLDGHERVDEAQVELENEAEAESKDDAEVESEDEASGAAQVGTDTTTSSVGLDGNSTTDGEERKSSRVKRERRPNKVSMHKETITKVNVSGHPTLPIKVARGYGNQLASSYETPSRSGRITSGMVQNPITSKPFSQSCTEAMISCQIIATRP